MRPHKLKRETRQKEKHEMAVTKVRDEQLKLDDVDQSVKLKNASEALRLESATPSLFLRETDQALADGLYKAALNGKDLVLKKKGGVGGVFSPEMKLLPFLGGKTLSSRYKIPQQQPYF